MNELGIRKLPRDDDGLDPEKVGKLLVHSALETLKHGKHYITRNNIVLVVSFRQKYV